jgi:hypothetical protein
MHDIGEMSPKQPWNGWFVSSKENETTGTEVHTSSVTETYRYSFDGHTDSSGGARDIFDPIVG